MHTWEEYQICKLAQSYTDVVLNRMFKCYSMYIFSSLLRQESKVRGIFDFTPQETYLIVWQLYK